MVKKIAICMLMAVLFLSILSGCGRFNSEEPSSVDDLEPTNEEISAEVLWRFFSICKIPHTTGNEAELSKYLEFQIKQMGFACVRDVRNNVIAEIPATPGFEDSPLTILQGHMDMVAAKDDIDDQNTTFEPVNVQVGSAIVQSDKTSTLGADCGLANAAILYLIGQPDYVHGPLRIIFTTRGEENMAGAQNVDDVYVQNAKYLINVSGLQLDNIIAGSAAGRREIYQMPLSTEPVVKERALKVEITGFAGGHYGSDMWRKRANAVKIMADLLSRAEKKIDFQLVDWKGGGALDSIPSQSEAVVVLDQYDSPAFEKIIFDIIYEIQEKYKESDPNGQLTYSVAPLPQIALSEDCKKKTIQLISGFFDGIYSQSDSDPNDILTSANVERISIRADIIRIIESFKSDIPEELNELIVYNAALNQSAGFNMQAEEMPAWKMDKENNSLIKIMEDAYRRKTGQSARVISGHSDLETPIFLEKNPSLRAVTIGPDIIGAHTVNEYLKIDSIGPFVKTLASALHGIALDVEEEEE